MDIDYCGRQLATFYQLLNIPEERVSREHIATCAPIRVVVWQEGVKKVYLFCRYREMDL